MCSSTGSCDSTLTEIYVFTNVFPGRLQIIDVFITTY